MNPLTYGVASLRRSFPLALTIIATLGVALAAAITVFSFLNSFLIQPVPYGDGARVVVIYEKSLSAGAGSLARLTYGNFVDLKERATSFSRLAMFRNESVTVHAASGTEVAFVQRVTPDAFPMMHARAALGAVITPENAEVGGVRAVLLSDALWRRRFGADPAIVGRLIQLDTANYQVVGVLPPDFRVPTGDNDPQAWLALLPADYLRNERTQRRHHVWGELAPGRTLAAAQGELTVLAGQLRAEHPKENADRGLQVLSLRDDLLGDFDRHLVLLQGAVLLVLTVACLNSLCLLFARAIERRREFALRLALGASRRHLFTQLLAEGFCLTGPAAVLGCVLANAALPLGVSLLPPFTSVNALAQPRIDLTVVLAVGVAAAVVAGVFAAVPLLQLRRLNIEATLRAGARSAGSATRAHAARWLAGIQIAVALALLICATLLIRSQLRLAALHPGFPIESLDSFRVGLRGSTYADPARRLAFYDAVMDQVRALPGVDAVTTVNFPTNGPGSGFLQDGDSMAVTETPKRAVIHAIAPDFFAVFDLKPVAGRLLTDHDLADHAHVAVISASLAQKYWANASPIGKRILLEGRTDNDWFEVVGVVSDTIGWGDQPRVIDSIYVTLAQWSPPGLGMAFVVRHTGPGPSERALQAAVARVDPDMQFFAHASLAAQYENAAWQSHFVTQLVGAFALLSVVMSLAGIYAVKAFLVARRTTEFGVRAALGATGQSLLRMVVAENLRLALIAIVGGVFLAIGASRGLTTLLYGVSSVDVATYAFGAVAMTLACVGATLLPARRAAHVDPVVALRSD